ncbi:MAG: hypothetical protein LAP86_29065 [Acidobacteriia bacterium]|nr:hypothetical protein [Terriglobia bacterium]
MKAEQKGEIAWAKEDEVRWVQWRVRERKALEACKPTAEAWRIKGKFRLVDYQAWLLRQKGGFAEISATEMLELFPAEVATVQPEVLPLSYQRIGDLLFAELDDPDNRKKRAADAHNRVESEFRRGSLKRSSKPIIIARERL